MDRELCKVCGKNKQKKVAGKDKYRPYCSPCSKRLYENNHARNVAKYKRPYRKHVKDTCERCGFIPVHSCQLDVHHKDHNHSNNTPENLETLCANCHRLEHKEAPPGEYS